MRGSAPKGRAPVYAQFEPPMDGGGKWGCGRRIYRSDPDRMLLNSNPPGVGAKAGVLT